MDKKYGYYIFGGMLLGALLGSLAAGSANVLQGLGLGALAGTFIGWFAAAAVMEIAKGKKEGK
jgi:hypothetical protein